ncbi:MAG: DNA polymerase III subunit delta [Candidatus Gracilibacteria bacterium]|nr:DNA polymerase III subunit delta [Candidatus Gracilibacteria bacterium]
MLFFLYGADDYSSRQKLDTLKAKFIEKNGDFNVTQLESEKLNSLGIFKEVLQTVPLFGEKKLVIIKNLLKESKDAELKKQIADNLNTIDQNNFLVFYESGDDFDKRQSLYKKLQSLAQIEEFKTLAGYQLNKWIENRVQEAGVEMTADAVNQLAASVGGNLWQMQNELHKLALLKLDSGRAITTDDVQELVTASLQSNIFNMIDYLGQKKVKLALKELETLKDSGEHEIYLLSMFVYQFRNLIQAKEILNQGGNKNDLAKRARLHPFVATKSVAQAENFSFKELKQIYEKLLQLDWKLKTGQIETGLALEKFIIEVAT